MSGVSSQSGTAFNEGRGSKSQASFNQNGFGSVNSQAGFREGGSSTNVQTNGNGGEASAHSTGQGQTSSQAQIGFNNGNSRSVSRGFIGGGQSSAQSRGFAGQAQSQLYRTSQDGRFITGGAQAGSGNFLSGLKTLSSDDKGLNIDDKRLQNSDNSQPGSNVRSSSHYKSYNLRRNIPPLPKPQYGKEATIYISSSSNEEDSQNPLRSSNFPSFNQNRRKHSFDQTRNYANGNGNLQRTTQNVNIDKSQPRADN